EAIYSALRIFRPMLSEPPPSSLDLLIHVPESRVPAKCFVRSTRIADEYRRVTPTAGTKLRPFPCSGDAFACPYRFAPPISAPNAQIECRAGLARRQPFDGGNVCIGQVADMDIITNASTIRCRIIAAEYRYNRLPPHRRQSDERNELGFGLVQLTKLPIGVR